MKRLLIIAAGAAGFMISACDKAKDTETASGGAGAKVGEQAALDAFKADVKAMKKWSEDNKPDPANPAGGIAMMTEMGVKMKAVRTQGLPADLNAGYQKMLAVMDKMQAAMKELPADPATADAETGARFQAKMEAITKEGDAAAAELKTLGKKYGLEDLELGK